MRYTEKSRINFKAAVVEVAPRLLGCVLCHRLRDGTILRFRINEVEAYYGLEKFCYGQNGNNPKNKSAMFYSVAHLCDYASMLMISCGSDDNADNILIRAAEQLTRAETVEYESVIALHDAFIAGQSINDTDLLTSQEVWIEPPEQATVHYCKHKRINIPSNEKRRYCLQEAELTTEAIRED